MNTSCGPIVIQNYFEPCILFTILKKPSYGYDIQKELKEKCVCNVNVGNLYRCLNRFEKQNFVTKDIIKSNKGPSRKLYGITREGRAYLQTWMQALENQQAVLNSLLVQYKQII